MSSPSGKDTTVITALIAATAVIVAAIIQVAFNKPSTVVVASPNGITIPITSSRESFIVQNKLALPINIYIDNVYKGTVEKYSEEKFFLESIPVNVSWSIIKQQSGSTSSIGDNMGATFINVKNDAKLTVNNYVVSQLYFYPIITNNADKSCEISINDGYITQNRPGASIPAHSKRVALGYYKAFTNSNITLYCGERITWWGEHPSKGGKKLTYLGDKNSGVMEMTINP